MKVLEIGNNALVPIQRIVYAEQYGKQVRLYLDGLQNGAGYVICSFHSNTEALGAVQEIAQKMRED